MSEFVVLLERLIGWAELWGMGTDSHSAEKLADTRDALVEYVTGLEEEVERLREAVSEMNYHIKHSKDCRHGNGFTYDFCPFVNPPQPPEVE